MGALEFIAAIVDSLAWPLAIVVVGLFFRAELRSLLLLLRKLKAGPVEAEFDKQVEELKRETESIVKETAQIAGPDADEKQKLMELANYSPRSAIVESWVRLEGLLRQLAWQHAGSPQPDVSSPHKLMKEIESLNLLRADEISLIQDLQGLRNQAVHISNLFLTQSAAKDFVESAFRLESRIRKLAVLDGPTS